MYCPRYVLYFGDVTLLQDTIEEANEEKKKRTNDQTTAYKNMKQMKPKHKKNTHTQVLRNNKDQKIAQ